MFFHGSKNVADSPRVVEVFESHFMTGCVVGLSPFKVDLLDLNHRAISYGGRVDGCCEGFRAQLNCGVTFFFFSLFAKES